MSSEPGFSFEPRDTAAWIDSQVLHGQVSSALFVQISDKAGVCPIADPRLWLAGAQTIHIEIGTPGAAVVVGTYYLFSSGQSAANVWMETADSQCGGTAYSAMSGTLTIDTITSSEVAGSFDVFSGAMQQGSELSGKFVAPLCTKDASADAGPPTCG